MPFTEIIGIYSEKHVGQYVCVCVCVCIYIYLYIYCVGKYGMS
jgi:hypothetical protein